MDRSMILAKYEPGNLRAEDRILDEIFIRAFMIFHRGKELRLDESTVFYFGVKFFRWLSVELDLDENLYMICCDIFVAKENHHAEFWIIGKLFFTIFLLWQDIFYDFQ